VLVISVDTFYTNRLYNKCDFLIKSNDTFSMLLVDAKQYR
jgi:hypothetical protein